ncbi:unannotated protein [freshwater metagenome]|uniref:Unannotated protein n=1 Tax=freshwater metagenome TaxID=449393 RepID=A0A6J6YAE7_9ZZZZ
MPLRTKLKTAVVTVYDAPAGKQIGNFFDIGLVVAAVDADGVEFEHLARIVLDRQPSAIGP